MGILGFTQLCDRIVTCLGNGFRKLCLGEVIDRKQSNCPGPSASGIITYKLERHTPWKPILWNAEHGVYK